MLKVLVALLFAATVYSAYVEIDNSGHTFRISVNPASEVRWTKDGLNYRHLQELARYCTVPGTPVALGGIGNWQCAPYDTLLNINCTADGGLFNPVIKQINGEFTCAAELDTFAYLQATCTEGQTVKYINGQWVCAPDADTFADLQRTCPSGTTIQWNGNAFICTDSSIFVDSDLLGTITCAPFQVVRFDGTTFVCSNDMNTQPPACTAGQLIVYTGSAWACKTDDDFLAVITIPSCSTSTPYLKYRNGQWICVRDYYVLNIIDQPGFLTYLQSANILQQTATPQDITNYEVLWGSIAQATLFSNAPPVFPFGGTITSTYITFQNWKVSPGTQIRLRFSVGGVNVTPNLVFNVSPDLTSFSFLTPLDSVGQQFSAGETVALGFDVISGKLETSPPDLSSIYVAVYISVTIKNKRNNNNNIFINLLSGCALKSIYLSLSYLYIFQTGSQ